MTLKVNLGEIAESIAAKRETYGFDNYVALIEEALFDAYKLGSAFDEEGIAPNLLAALKGAAPHVCSLLCPSTWTTGHRPPHHERCQAIAAAIAKAEAPRSRETHTVPDDSRGGEQNEDEDLARIGHPDMIRDFFLPRRRAV